jgi:predicted P-loop ATPase
VPDGAITTITAQRRDEVRAFVAQHDGQRNLYFSVNPTRKTMNSKAAKIDIAAIEYLPGDLDPAEGETPADAKARYTTALAALKPAPTVIIDSGNGIQTLHKLARSIALPEPKGTDVKGKPAYRGATAKLIAAIEARTKTLMESLGAVGGTQNIDRLLRLPGTTNLPNAKKRKDGRVACQATLIHFHGVTCRLQDLPKSDAGNGTSPGSGVSRGAIAINWTKVKELGAWLKTAADLPGNFNAKGRLIVAHRGNLKDLHFDLKREGFGGTTYQSWSDVTQALAAIFVNNGGFNLEQIAAALLSPLECNQHVLKYKDDETAQRRAIERAIERAITTSKKAAQRGAGEPAWRETRDDGSPVASFHNARLAIEALGVECTYDVFHNEMLFGHKDDRTRHTVQKRFGSVVEDDGILALRHVLSNNFGFDLLEKHVRDAVRSIALQHRFNPNADTLAAAQALWERDGVPRLHRMAADYLNCEDTPLNAMCIRKHMIAAVARVRNPGCKYDTIVVLESIEGFNKSSAIEKLAGVENFSDESIIGKDSREVQENLAPVWMHENADLAGMAKREVEAVKSYASRTVDRARPAYGHFHKKQPRHSIEWGTTNSDKYLLSQTGNRRFWGMKVLRMIDLEKLGADRLLLLGEAAHYQSQGESLTLPEAMWAEAGVEQEKRRVEDPWEDILAALPVKIEKREWSVDQHRFVMGTVRIIHYAGLKEELVIGTDILQHVLGVAPERQHHSHPMRVANIMKRLGWGRPDNGRLQIGGKRVKGYVRKR